MYHITQYLPFLGSLQLDTPQYETGVREVALGVLGGRTTVPDYGPEL